MAEDPAAFAGEFAVLQAFEVRVRGDVKPLRGRARGQIRLAQGGRDVRVGFWWR